MPIQFFVFVVLLSALSACSPSPSELARYEVAVNGIHGGSFSHNGALAVVSSVHHGGSLWRLRDQERLYNWNHDQQNFSVILSADIEVENRWALTAEAHTLVLWNVSTGEAARFWTAPGEVLDLTLARGGRYAILGQADHSAVIFNTIEGGIVRSFTHQGRVRSVDLSGDGRLAITGSEDQTAILWRVDNGEPIMVMEHQEDVQVVAISPDGRYGFTAAKYDRAEIWDLQERRSLMSLKLSKEKIKRGLEITSARFSSDGQQLLLGYTNRTVELWQIIRGSGVNEQKASRLRSWLLSKRHKWQPTGVSVVDLAFSQNGYYAMGSSGFIYHLQ